MISLFRSDQVYACEDISSAVKLQLQQLPRMVSAIGRVDVILRYEFECEPIRPLSWLHNQDCGEKLYWSDRDGGEETAGVGVAKMIRGTGEVDYQTVFDEIDVCLSADNQRIRFYGGFCFDARHVAREWTDFGGYRFVVPRFELYRTLDCHVFAVNVGVNEICEEMINGILQQLENLDLSRETHYRKVPRRLNRVDHPNYGDWEELLVGWKREQASKIVLARKTDFAFHIRIRPDALINFLKQRSPGCYHFCFQPRPHHGFVGAPPERLMRIAGRQLQTEAVAGTMPTGANEAQCRQYRDQLLSSEKCRREQQFVIDHLRERLAGLCTKFDCASEPDVIQLKNIQHLMTPFWGELQEQFSRADVMQALHPTPAVCGYPIAQSRDDVAKLEGFSRGWYAGPVGYVGYDICEFAVAIRSGLVADHILALYAGAGIVEGSYAPDEWQEIENKISRFMKVFQ